MDNVLRIISRADAKAQGLTYYFTGKPCKRGHIAERFLCNSTCVECSLEQSGKWAAENLDRKRENGRKRYAASPEKHRERSRRYRAKNPEKVRIRYAAKTAELGCSPSAHLNRIKRAAGLGCSIDELPPRRPQTEPSRYVYALSVNGLERPYIKIGITNDPEYRLNCHKRKLGKSGLSYSSLGVLDMETEDAARDVEKVFAGFYQNTELEVDGFKNEMFEFNPFTRNIWNSYQSHLVC